MIPFGDLKDNIALASNRSTSPDYMTRIAKMINRQYLEICRGLSLEGLRDTVSIDFSSDDYDDGMWLPSDILGIDRVRDSDGFEFYRREQYDVEPDEYGYRFYTYRGADDPLLELDDVAVASGASAFSSSDLGAADHTGEYIKFGLDSGYHLLDTATTFTPAYYGEDLTDEYAAIRPVETKKIVIIDSEENEITDKTVSVYYWKSPRPLVRNWDVPILPSVRLLELMVLRELPEAKARRPVGVGELKEAKEELLSMSPQFPRAARPRDKQNRIFEASVNPFSRRGNKTPSSTTFNWVGQYRRT